ncbi:MAG: stage V sporulation protein D, partial [Clostridia bacterium]|nr:stage V sporulation protein D [Clostridia bacterium]
MPNNNPTSTVRKRMIPGRSMIILMCFMAFWCVLIFRLFQLQIIDYDKYQNKVINNIQRYTTLKAERGEIYDKNMNKLASNYTVYRIFISPRDIDKNGNAELVSKGLSEILGVDYDKRYALPQKTHRADETVLKKATEEKADAVRAFILANDLKLQVHLEAGSSRFYPFSSLAANVIGVVGTDQGLSGLELEYNSFLRGESGKYITSKDAQGGQMPGKYDTYIDASNGANLVTTIDVTIQRALEKQVKQAYLDSNPLNRVTGIVMDCDTGAILGMATYPSFDLNSPYQLDEASQAKLDSSGFDPESTEYSKYKTDLLYTLWRNKPVSELYEPGSTFKIITSAMSLEEGVVSPNEGFYCSGSYRVAGYENPIHCHRTRGHGSVTFTTGLQMSCNPVMMTLSLRLGQSTFYKYFESFGITSITGIDLPGEASYIYSTESAFNEFSLAVYSFGQTFKFTPIPHINAINTVAIGCNLITPYVVYKIIYDDVNILMQH